MNDNIRLTNPQRYWANRRIRVEVEDSDGLSTVTLEKPFAIVGSSSSADLVLSDPRISARSAYLHSTPRGVCCVLLDGCSAFAPQDIEWLNPGNELTLGDTRLSVQEAGSEVASQGKPTPPETTSAFVSQFPLIEVYLNGSLQAEHSLRYHLTVVGRTKSGGFDIECRSVSRVHCALYWEAGELWAIDLLSGNGTRVEGRKVEAAIVPPMSSIEIGNIKLVYRGLSHLRAGNSATGEASSPRPQSDTYDSATLDQAAALQESYKLAKEMRQLKASLSRKKQRLDRFEQELQQAREEAGRASELEEQVRELKVQLAETAHQPLQLDLAREQSRQRLLSESLACCAAELALHRRLVEANHASKAARRASEEDQRASELEDKLRELEAQLDELASQQPPRDLAREESRQRLLSESLACCAAELRQRIESLAARPLEKIELELVPAIASEADAALVPTVELPKRPAETLPAGDSVRGLMRRNKPYEPADATLVVSFHQRKASFLLSRFGRASVIALWVGAALSIGALAFAILRWTFQFL